MILPEEYTIQKFHQLAGYPKVKQLGKVHEAGCPICREGSSWGKKRRLYFILKDDHIYCHNCGWTGNSIKFIQQVEGLEYNQIVKEASQYDLLPADISESKTQFIQKTEAESLPHDSINILDSTQLNYHTGNKIIDSVVTFATNRKLFSACNRPKTLWVSLSDYTHKNRLIIPFYDTSNNIVFYQSRSVLNTDKYKPKYLSKIGSDKSIFNIDNIDNSLDKIFIFEGPIDACFCKNGVAVAGIQENSNTSFNQTQLSQLNEYNFFDRIWALDSQWQDRAAKIKTEKLIDQDQTVFIWPEKYGKRFKDFNDMAVALNINEIPYKFILDNSYTGLKAKILLANLDNA